MPGEKTCLRIRISNREAATYVKLRMKGHRINHIAKAFGRSSSVVWRRLRFNASLNPHLLSVWLTPLDMRKMPQTTRLKASCSRWRSLLSYLPAWEAWICGIGEKPP